MAPTTKKLALAIVAAFLAVSGVDAAEDKMAGCKANPPATSNLATSPVDSASVPEATTLSATDAPSPTATTHDPDTVVVTGTPTTTTTPSAPATPTTIPAAPITPTTPLLPTTPVAPTTPVLPTTPALPTTPSAPTTLITLTSPAPPVTPTTPAITPSTPVNTPQPITPEPTLSPPPELSYPLPAMFKVGYRGGGASANAGIVGVTSPAGAGQFQVVAYPGFSHTFYFDAGGRLISPDGYMIAQRPGNDAVLLLRYNPPYSTVDENVWDVLRCLGREPDASGKATTLSCVGPDASKKRLQLCSGSGSIGSYPSLWLASEMRPECLDTVWTVTAVGESPY